MHMQPRRRIAFTSEQLNRLEDAFQRCPYPKTEIRMKLALETQLSETRIQVWFKNRRAKYRKKLRNKSDNKVLHDISTPKYNSVITWRPNCTIVHVAHIKDTAETSNEDLAKQSSQVSTK